MISYKLKRTYSVGYFTNPFYTSNFKTYCHSRKLEFNVNIYQRIVSNMVGTCVELRGARIYLFEDKDKNIVFGINDKCVFIEDIVDISWRLDWSCGRVFSCKCKNPVDNISIIYERNEERWIDPLEKFNDLYSPIPDTDDIWMYDLGLIVSEAIENNYSMERFHAMCFCYYK